MAQSDFTDDIGMLIAFNQDGYARWVEFSDGARYTVPLPQDEGPQSPDTFRSGPLNTTGPLTNVNLLKTEVFQILKWEELDNQGSVIKTHYSPIINGRLYC